MDFLDFAYHIQKIAKNGATIELIRSLAEKYFKERSEKSRMDENDIFILGKLANSHDVTEACRIANDVTDPPE